MPRGKLFGKRRMRGVLAMVVLALAGGSTRAQRPIQWSGLDGNGHYYEFGKFADKNWYDADTYARSRSYRGMTGHLVTIQSAGEQQFLVDRIQPDYYSVWYGAYQDVNAPDYREPSGGWRWVTGEPWSYTNWARNEPNNYNNGPGFEQEDGLIYSNSPTLSAWNDAPRSWRYPSSGFVIEYEPIAEPGTLALLSSAALATRLARRRRLVH